MTFDVPTYHVQQFLPYNVLYLGAFFDPLPTLKSDVIYGRSLKAGKFQKQIVSTSDHPNKQRNFLTLISNHLHVHCIKMWNLAECVKNEMFNFNLETYNKILFFPRFFMFSKYKVCSYGFYYFIRDHLTFCTSTLLKALKIDLFS